MQKNLNKTISQLLHHEWVGPTPTHDDSFIQQKYDAYCFGISQNEYSCRRRFL